MTTNNEAFEIWYESRFGKEGLKTALNHPYLLDGEYVYESTKDKLFIWQAATTEANKRIAELEVQLQNWKDFSKKVQKIDFNDYLQLQASNNNLREALDGLIKTKIYKDMQGKDITYELMRLASWHKAEQALAATPAESLQEKYNEALEKTANIAIKTLRPDLGIAVAEQLRSQKEVK
jgi:hypothetical protein